jgi:hypothetical protein
MKKTVDKIPFYRLGWNKKNLTPDEAIMKKLIPFWKI